MQNSNLESSFHGHLQLYKEQSDSWFIRETRSGKCDCGNIQVSQAQDSSSNKTASQTESCKISRKSSNSIIPSQRNDLESCAGCDPSRNEMIKSQNYVKILANNISICNRHRVICEALLDMQKYDPINQPPYPPEALLNDDGPRYSVNEDRRLRRAVRQCGENAWSEIAYTGDFAFGRTADDLKERWYKLCQMNYDEF